ncbi:hypothetical protein BaRGS_00015538 [Batillaria attramentaria]|uniref:G-protein coupled receptors family 1 profile domain-containing protein n=1 Tax=Batillaria attramentaria TaxID=370345 RepID=A0ABD0L1J7_9CAEN
MSNVSVPRGSGLFIQVYSSKELWPVIATLFFMVGLLVLVLNAVTVLLFSRSPSLRSPSNMMTASLAVTDLSLGVVIIWCALGWVPCEFKIRFFSFEYFSNQYVR